jgi:hypothetical protein
MRQVAPSNYHSKLLKQQRSDLARKVNRGSSSAAMPQKRKSQMSHLDNIAIRQRKSLIRDALFASFVALATIVSVTTVTQVAAASSTVAHR